MQDWRSYNSAAENHERIAVPHFFTGPARDLVARLELVNARDILDVGAGTGVAALAAKGIAPAARIVALDPAVEMLKTARRKGLFSAAGRLPDLPFASMEFDRVLANFVISHVPSYLEGLREMVRVLRPGGILGVTAWGPLECECRTLWQEIADSFVGKETLREAVRGGLAWEDWFMEPEHLRSALEEAGLTSVTVHHIHYTAAIPVADYIAVRGTAFQGRFIRQTLGPQKWTEFNETLEREFDVRFGDLLDHTRDVYIVTGRL